MQNNFILHLNITGSCTIEDCLKQALKLAKELEVIVEFKHDTQVIQVSYDSDFRKMLADYNKSKSQLEYIIEQSLYKEDHYPTNSKNKR